MCLKVLSRSVCTTQPRIETRLLATDLHPYLLPGFYFIAVDFFSLKSVLGGLGCGSNSAFCSGFIM